MKYKIVHSELFSGEQSWDYHEYRTYGEPKFGGSRRRVRIHRDAYDFQSSVVAEVWLGGGWSEVLTLSIGKTPAAKVSYVWSEDRIGDEFTETANKLFDLAAVILD